jgi:glyoxylase I family protein
MLDRERRERAMPDTANIGTREADSTGAAVNISGLDHVVLRVGDLDRAIAFYENVLNCRVERRLEQPKLVQLRAGASLIDLVPASGSPGDAADPAGRNMDHFAVRVDGFDAAALAAHLRRHGITVGEVRERYGAEGYGPSLYITDPDGNTVELKGPPETAA